MKIRRGWKLVTLLLLLSNRGYLQAQEAVKENYNALFYQAPQKVPTGKTPDGPLTGNGDIGLSLGGTPERLFFFLGKNDFWRAYPVYPGGGIALPGRLELNIEALKAADYFAEQHSDSAMITAKFKKQDHELLMESCVIATQNMVLISLSSNKTCKLNLQLQATEGNTSVNGKGIKEGVKWVSRSFENTPLLEWPSHIAIALKLIGGNTDANGDVMLQSGKKLQIVLCMYSNHDRKDWKEGAIKEASSMTAFRLAKMKREHQAWWADFWKASKVSIADPVLQKYYHASQYLFACSSRGNKFAPGIWGPFITRDSSSWGGDYHLNYNYQAPYWAAYSSNHLDETDNFDQPLLDYMGKGKEHAKALLGIRGIYYPVGIGPKGLVTTRWPLSPEEMEKRYATRENTIDGGYKFLGQKINAVFSVGNMMMRFYSTYDKDYAKRVYPYLIECANFWEDYLKFENGRYVIYMDHYGEVMPNLKNKGQWRNLLGDFNSTLSLGLVRLLFKGIVDMSTFLNLDSNRQEKWKHIRDHLSDFPLGEVDGQLSLRSVERSPAPWHQPVHGLARVSIHGLILPGGVCGPVTDAAFNQILRNDVARWKSRMNGPGEWGNTLGNGIETCFPAAVRVGYDPEEILNQLKDRIRRQSLPNLWITADGGGLETLSAVPMTINEMLMQSYEQVIRIFPNWTRSKDASFDQLRAYGAFLISSTLKNKQILYVKIYSERGRPCVIDNPWPGNQVQLFRNGKKVTLLSGARFNLPTKEGDHLELLIAR